MTKTMTIPVFHLSLSGGVRFAGRCPVAAACLHRQQPLVTGISVSKIAFLNATME
jgi:hypothetical protein